MKKNYVRPELEINMFSTVNVLLSSEWGDSNVDDDGWLL